jgi:hypothetical protein
MAKKKSLKNLNPKKVTIFKIKNRRGYASLCYGNLTEGTTPLQAYLRMNKALKRMGFVLKQLTMSEIQKLVQ